MMRDAKGGVRPLAALSQPLRFRSASRSRMTLGDRHSERGHRTVTADAEISDVSDRTCASEHIMMKGYI